MPVPPPNATKLDKSLHKLRLYQIGLVKQQKEEKPAFVGIDLENPDACVIDVDDEDKLAKIVCSEF